MYKPLDDYGISQVVPVIIIFRRRSADEMWEVGGDCFDEVR